MSSFLSCKGSNPIDNGGTNIGNNDVIIYEKSMEIFPNPERGFFNLYAISSEESVLDLNKLMEAKNENVTLIHITYYFEKFKQSPLSDTQLSIMMSDMSKIRQAGMKVMLAFAYCGKGEVVSTGEDAPFSTIEKHLNQLQPFFEKNKDIIYLVCASFIGPWGEWHDSSNGLDNTYYKTKVLEKMISVMPEDMLLSIRTPRDKQAIYKTQEPVTNDLALQKVPRARIGHHNHCFLASVDDYGTYVNVDAEMLYISREGLYVPVGGETCPPNPDDYNNGCEVAITTMRKLRWSYLNLDWYVPTLDKWRNGGCFEEIQREMGHRLRLVKAKFGSKVGVDMNLAYDITMFNDGYAPLYNEKTVSLVCKNVQSGKYFEFQIPADIRNCKPLIEYQIAGNVKLSGLAAGNYELYIKISDRDEMLKKRVEYSVQLANKNTWIKDNGGMNKLSHNITIE